MDGYILQTSAGMYRAPTETNAYPWSEEAKDAAVFPTETDAARAGQDHANFSERGVYHYRIIEVATGHVTPLRKLSLTEQMRWFRAFEGLDNAG